MVIISVMTVWSPVNLFLALILRMMMLNHQGALVSGSQAPLHLHTGTEKVPGQYIVVLQDNVDLDAFVEAYNSFTAGADPPQQLFRNAVKGFCVHLEEDVLNQVRESRAVKYVEEDGFVYAEQSEGPASWGLDRVDQRDLPLDDITDFRGTGAGTHIYIIDTGVRGDHIDFGMRFSYAESYVAPYTFGDGGDMVGEDCHGHGTHCAGTAAGATFGVATQATIHSVKVLKCPSGSSLKSVVIEGMEWVITNAQYPAVLSMSIGGSYSATQNDAVTNVHNAGIVVVAAAGNNNDLACSYSPASAPKAITVAASDVNDDRASFSNYGFCVDIFAPGVSITSAYKSSPFAYTTWSGTSMACPHVAGAAAVLLGIDSSLTPSQIAGRLVSNASPNKISDPGTGTQNQLLYIGDTNDFSSEPLPPPTPGPSDGQSGPCCDGWHSYQDGCYHYINLETTWQEAHDVCTGYGPNTELVSIHSNDENNIVTILSMGNKVWTGLNDITMEGQMVWSDNSAVGYTNWRNNNSRNQSLRDCVRLGTISGQAGAWSFVKCSNNLGFVCRAQAD